MSFRASCRKIPELNADRTVPDWIEILPPGVNIIGRDGRSFQNSDPQRFVLNSSPEKQAIPVDYDHGTELMFASDGRAAGWVVAVEERDGGSIWTKVEWTPAGAKAIQDREYRFISPAFIHDKGNEVLKLLSVGLTNSPNLKLSSLNTARPSSGESKTKMEPKILKALGLAADATEADVLAAINAVKGDLSKAVNAAAAPSLALFVPRDDYNLALNRATEAEAELATGKADAMTKGIDVAINSALKERKITPAQESYHRAQCATEGGLERFTSFCSVAASVIPKDPVVIDGAPSGEGGTSLNAAQAASARALCMTPQEYKARQKTQVEVD